MTTTSPEPVTSTRTRGRWRMPWLPFGIALLALVGVGLLLYPAGAAWFTQYQFSQRIDDYSSDVRKLDPGVRAAEIRRAEDYNARLLGGASVAAGERIPLAQGGEAADGHEYDSLLAADVLGLMARIKIPDIQVDLPIYHGTSDEVLLRGVGHIASTALPVGGVDTHAVLTGHRGLASAELFTHLDQLEIGDAFTLEVFGEVLTYGVVETLVVEPDETETLYPQRGRDLVTLVTCTPLGINSHRILVTAERVLPTPAEDIATAGRRPDVPSFPWWTLGLAGTVVLLTAYVWWSGRPASTRRVGVPRRR